VGLIPTADTWLSFVSKDSKASAARRIVKISTRHPEPGGITATNASGHLHHHQAVMSQDQIGIGRADVSRKANYPSIPNWWRIA